MQKFTLVFFLLTTTVVVADDANSVVRKADAVRGPQGSFRMKIRVSSE